MQKYTDTQRKTDRFIFIPIVESSRRGFKEAQLSLKVLFKFSGSKLSLHHFVSLGIRA